MRLKRSYIGIDPGAKGGVSLVFNGKLISSNNCPDNVKDMNKLIKDLMKGSDDISNWVNTKSIRCYIENVWAFPTDMRSAAFKFGKNFGMWLGILAANNIKTILVSPQMWQKEYGKMPKDKKERKNKLKSIASKISGSKATLVTADSILIAYYGYQKEKEKTNE